MNSVTVDPEMKKRIMSSVSAAIREQGSSTGSVNRPEVRKTPESARVSGIPKEQREEQPVAPVRKKAKKTPVIVISSIAAVILILMGVLFVTRYIGASTKSASDVQVHNEWINKAAAETIAAGIQDNYAESPAAAGEMEDTEDERYKNDIVFNADDTDDSRRTLAAETTYASEATTAASVDGSEGMGDARIDAIAKALPFDLKGTGSGQFAENITEELFTGNDGEKVLLYTAPEGTDIYKTVIREDIVILSEGTTPDGYAIRYCRCGFVNVADLAEGETSADVNAAVFTKNGSTYLIIFSDIQPEEVIGRVADAV